MDQKKTAIKDKDRRISELEREVGVIGDRYQLQFEQLEGKIVEKDKLLEEAELGKKRFEDDNKKLIVEIEKLRAGSIQTEILKDQIGRRIRSLKNCRVSWRILRSQRKTSFRSNNTSSHLKEEIGIRSEGYLRDRCNLCS